jgi:hypothetical protein
MLYMQPLFLCGMAFSLIIISMFACQSEEIGGFKVHHIYIILFILVVVLYNIYIALCFLKVSLEINT